jgi:hypothetical protein
MLRKLLIVALALYLIVVGLWPAAAEPVSLMFAGLAAIGALVPGYIWALAAGAAWLRYRRPVVIQPATA